MKTEKIAIIGKAFRLPTEIDNDDDLWNALLNEKDLITEVDNKTFDKRKFFHEDRNRSGKSCCFSAGILENKEMFDPAFFNISQKEAKQMDPQQRILMELSWRAIEDAGYNPHDLKGKNCGVYIGIYDMDHNLNGSADLAALESYSPMGGSHSIAANRISYFFDFHGPSMAIDTACSSGMVAMHLACNAIRSKDIEMAIVGSVSLLQHPQPFVSLSKANILSAEGRCKSFSNSNNGYVRSEGAGVFVIKPLSESENDNDLIQGVLLNTVSNCDGKTDGLPRPSMDAQCNLMKKAYSDIELDLSKISYVEAHGTGTKVGDPTEVSSISNAIALKRKEKLPIGSIKSNLGHMEPTSGFGGVLKALMCIKHGKVPATIHCEELNPDIDFEKANIKIVNELHELDRSEKIIIGVNSFGFGGSNTHAIISEYTPRTSEHIVNNLTGSNLLPPLLITANSENSLRLLVSKYIDLLNQDKSNYYNLAYNLVYNRPKHKCFAVVYGCKNKEEVTAALASYNEKDDNSSNLFTGTRGRTEGKTALVFSGNGCQWYGMAKSLLANSPEIARYLEEADSIFKKLAGFSIIEKIISEDDERIYSNTEIAQPALLVIQTAIVRYLQAKGVNYSAVIGHSVGEIAAAWACGALSLKDAITLIYHKSQCQAKTRYLGRMSVIGLGQEESAKIIEFLDISETVDIAGINSPGLTSLSGKESSLKLIEHYCGSKDIYYQFLDLDYPFHSKYMSEIEDELKIVLNNKLSPKNTKLKFISTAYGQQIKGEELTLDYWWDNIRKPVRFKAGIDLLINDGYANFIEIGTHSILLRSVGQCAEKLNKKVNLISTLKRNSDEQQELSKGLFNAWLASTNWDNSIWFPAKAQKMSLPAYPWDWKEYRATPTTDNNGVAYLGLEHPLLGWRIIQEETVWENHLDVTNCRELKDHIVADSLVFPAAGFIEMAVAANKLMNSSRTGYIDNMQLVTPLVLEQDITHQVQFRVNKKGYFNIRSRPRMSGNEWAVHVTGRLIEKEYFTELDDSCIRKTEKEELSQVITSEEHYDMTRSVGLNYKDKFRTVKSITYYKDLLSKVELIDKVEDNEDYLFGPSIIDGGIHSLISTNYLKLYYEGDSNHIAFLPAGFDSIHFLNSANKIERAAINILSTTKTSVKANIVFYDDDSTPVLLLNGARFNTAQLNPKTKLPQLYEYKPILQYSYNSDVLKSVKSKIRSSFDKFVHSPSAQLEEINDIHEQLLISYIVKAVRNIFPGDDIALTEYSSDEYKRLYWALNILEEDGYLLRKDNNSLIWNSDKEIFNSDEIFNLLVENYTETLSLSLYFARLGELMDKALLGELDSGELISGRSGLYEEIITNSTIMQPSILGVKSCLNSLLSSLDTNEKIKILEVGSGIFSNIFVEEAQGDHEIEYSLLTFDKSFVGKTVKRNINIDVKLIEENDSLSDVYIDQSFDLIICSDLFAFDNLPEAVEAIVNFLEGDGTLLLNESVPSIVQYFFNGLKPYSHSKFFSSKNISNVYELEQWNKLFTKFNMKLVKTVTDNEEITGGRFTSVFKGENCIDIDSEAYSATESSVEVTTLLICNSLDTRTDRLEKKIRRQYKSCVKIEYDITQENVDYKNFKNVVVLAPQEIDIDDVSLDLFVMSFVKELSKSQSDTKPNLTLITSGGALGNGDIGISFFRNPKHASLWALMRVVSNEYDAFLSVQLIDLQINDINDQLINLFTIQEHKELILTDLNVFSLHVTPVKINTGTDTIDEGQRVKLELNQKGSFSNLHWIKGNKKSPGKNEVAFKPMAVGLNFRDVMYSLGLIPEEVVENSMVGSNLGLDVSGIVLEVGENVSKFTPGDHIMGSAPGCFTTYKVADQSTLFKLPESWSFEEGATIFTVFLTAYTSLIDLARIQKGEKILIHGAAGGVGIAAIQIAKYKGAEIYATAGSDEKRDFLKLLGVEHIYNSRTLKFAEQIKNDTNGEGVDIILNCLANEAIDANFKILKPYGRFIEMGKRDIYEDYQIGLKPFRNNLSFFCINVEQLLIWRKELTSKMLKEIMELFLSEDLKPLPYKVFPASKIKEAYKYLQSAKHIGKLVIDMNDDKLTSEHSEENDKKLSGAYLVTGGSNGFGLDTAKWLTDKGAEKLILLSRGGKISKNELQHFKDKNVEVIIRSADVNSYEQLKAVFDEIKQLGINLKGIIHAAAVYDDELIDTMSPDKYMKVLFTKIKGATYLDQLSRAFDIEHFILYSSVTALFGNIGQVNYVAANGFLESLAMQRRSQGFNANYIALGGILDTGLLMRNTKLKKVLTSQMGNGLITVEQALMSLDKIITGSNAGFAVMDINVQQMEKAMPIFKSTRFDILRLTEKRVYSSKTNNFKKYIQELTAEEARNEVILLVREELAGVLELPLEEVVSNASIQDFGLDSLMGYDLAVSIEKSSGATIPPMSFQQDLSAEKIADILLSRILGEYEVEGEDEIATELNMKHGEDE